MFIDFREEGRVRKRERETSISCLPYVPQPGINPAIQVCALARNRTHKLLEYRMPQSTEPPDQAPCVYFRYNGKPLDMR